MKKLFIFSATIFAATAFAQESTSKSMSFENCLEVIRINAAKLGGAPVNIVETPDLRIVRFPAADGSVLLTCSRTDKKMVMTLSPK